MVGLNGFWDLRTTYYSTHIPDGALVQRASGKVLTGITGTSGVLETKTSPLVASLERVVWVGIWRWDTGFLINLRCSFAASTGVQGPQR